MSDSPVSFEAQDTPRQEGASAQSLRGMWGDLAKRVFDAAAALVGLVALSPFFIAISVMIKRDSPGPVFYRGPRMGRNGKLFQILKFRTMYENPEAYQGPRLTSRGDDRITALGRWLRDTKINELPQLWNVLRGEMSFVGPRPEDPEIMKSWPADVRAEILRVRPGITSPASVLYHSEEDLLPRADLMGLYFKDILPDKSRLDQLYVRNRSFAIDLDIIFWTTAIFIPRIARAKIPEGYLFAGPFSRIAHRYISWFFVDLLTALIAVAITTLAWRSQHPLNWGSDNLAVLALVLALLFSGVNTVTGVNRIVWHQAIAEDAVGLVISSSLVTFLLLALNLFLPINRLFPFPPLPLPMIVTLGLLAQIGFIATRYRLRLLSGLATRWLGFRRTAPGVGERVLIVGDGEASQIAHWLLSRGVLHHVFSLVGLVATDDPTKHGMRLHGCWVLGGIGDLATLASQNDVRMVIYAVPGSTSHIRDLVFDFCKNSNIKLIFLDDLLGLIDRQLEKPATSSEYLQWLHRRAESMAMHDALTGLPNSHLLRERVSHSLLFAKRYNTRPAMLFVGLNGLDSLRTAYGHRIEEDLLKIAATRLISIKRESDTLARFKTHEFALLLENVPDENAAEAILKRLMLLMSEPVRMKDKEVMMNAHMRICLSSKDSKEVKALKNSDLGQFYAGWRKYPDTTLDLVVQMEGKESHTPE